ncbi:MAG: hypothetical protein JNN07_03165 [Verrucomicrobiales bacterium]|nr:hypothetical protein [Verrucomicrobiales bacterium]
MIDVAEDDGTVSRKRSLTGFWRRTVEVDRYASVSDALADLFRGLTTDPAKWTQFTSVHRSGIAVCDPPPGSTPTSLFSGDELELFASLGLRVDLYFLSQRSLKNTQDASDKPPL